MPNMPLLHQRNRNLLIAVAILYDLMLLSRDRRHFQGIPDLTLYQPT